MKEVVQQLLRLVSPKHVAHKLEFFLTSWLSCNSSSSSEGEKFLKHLSHPFLSSECISKWALLKQHINRVTTIQSLVTLYFVQEGCLWYLDLRICNPLPLEEFHLIHIFLEGLAIQTGNDEASFTNSVMLNDINVLQC